MPLDATVTAADRADDAREVFMMNYLRLVGIVLLYWDHFITLDKEVDLFWRRRKSLSSYCFFINRYFALFTSIPSGAVPFLTLSRSACSQFCIFREVVLVLTQSLVAGIMVIRIYALFARSKRILYALVVLLAAVVGVVGYSLKGQHGYYPKVVGGCHWSMSDDTAMHLAGPWIGVFAFDAVVFAMTIYSACSTRKANGPATSIQTLVVRDGALYFGIVALVNLLNIATYYVDSELLCPGSLATIASCVSVTTISRLILNLHDYASHVGILSVSNHEPVDDHDRERQEKILGDEGEGDGEGDGEDGLRVPMPTRTQTQTQARMYAFATSTRTGPIVISI
ncbi:hypothetical protein C8F01DRAFT_1175021 [Mycena amicta]|nr:hypothetical protein C8F01DRAFT_1175021 [Mycena amicta]